MVRKITLQSKISVNNVSNNKLVRQAIDFLTKYNSFIKKCKLFRSDKIRFILLLEKKI